MDSRPTITGEPQLDGRTVSIVFAPPVVQPASGIRHYQIVPYAEETAEGVLTSLSGLQLSCKIESGKVRYLAGCMMGRSIASTSFDLVEPSTDVSLRCTRRGQ